MWIWMLIFYARWVFYKDVISFASLLQSFASMTDVIMLSNWPIFVDAAGDVGNWYISTIFFYSFKVRSGCDIFATICHRSIWIPRSQCDRDEK